MFLLNDISISDFDEKRKLIVSGGRHFLANEMTTELIQSLQNATTIEHACEFFCDKHDVDLSTDEFKRVITEKLGHYGILDDGHGRSLGRKSEYLKLKVQVLSERAVAQIANCFSFLFVKEIFWSLLTVSLAINAINFVFFINGEIKISGLILSVLLFGFSTAIHEIGHVSACRHFGAKHGGMGFGFYIIWPVAYSDITGIWTLKKHERIIANLGGIYMELFYAALLVMAGFLTNFKELNFAAIAISISAMVQLNPFLRMDGYWLLCDLAGQPNLMTKASKAIKETFIEIYNSISRHIQAESHQKESQGIWIFLYGIANISMGLIFMALIFVSYTQDLLSFPIKTFTIMQSVVRGSLSSSELTFPYFTAFTFYILLFLQMKSALSAIIKTQKPLLFSKLKREVRDN